MEDKAASLRAVVRGRVQGVNFRHFVYTKARSLRLTGHVCNLTNGGVEVVAEGSRADLDRLVDYLREGPRSARVCSMEVRWGEARGSYGTFDISG